MSKDVNDILFTRAGWKSLLEDAGFEILLIGWDLFVPAGAIGVIETRWYNIVR